MTEYRFEVSAEEAGSRVDACLARRLPLLSQTKLRGLIATGAASLAGNTLSIGQRLKAHDVVGFRFDPARTPCCYPEAIPVEVLREDPCFAVVNKPAGMLVHPTKGVKRGTLTNRLLAFLNPRLTSVEVRPEGGEPTLWPRFVHRLDRETSGAILLAKDSGSAASLGRALASGQFTKSYLAIVCGHLPLERYEVREPIQRYDDAPPHWRTGEDGQEAFSIVEPLRSLGKRLTLCRLQPVTGRTNQLRIHCSHLGAPILGDVLYGGEAAARLMLHAGSLEFPHPVGEERVSVSAPVPQAFREAWPADWPVLLEP
ncbi:MAG: RluA family pseudouridine synthase [Bryobacterales bacterium]|nr:RluA family pseudouridine synthase [Bryobacterales bacterium]